MTGPTNANFAYDAINSLLQHGLGQGLPRIAKMLLDAAMHPRATGHGTAGGPLLDRQGVLGTTQQSLLISPR